MQAYKSETPQCKGKGVSLLATGNFAAGTQHGERAAGWISALSTPLHWGGLVQCPTWTSVPSSCAGDLDEWCWWSECGERMRVGLECAHEGMVEELESMHSFLRSFVVAGRRKEDSD